MLRQLMTDVRRFLENPESRTPGQYALALAIVVVSGILTVVFVEWSRNKKG
jgi:hypothetical protein